MGKKKTIHGQCALCRLSKELQLSHIVPHFVGRKMIKTAPGNIRITNEPNKVAQDIECQLYFSLVAQRGNAN